MLHKLTLSAAIGVFALSGCEDHLPFAETFSTTVVVYLDGEPDHCIDAVMGDPVRTLVPLPQPPRPGTVLQPVLTSYTH